MHVYCSCPAQRNVGRCCTIMPSRFCVHTRLCTVGCTCHPLVAMCLPLIMACENRGPFQLATCWQCRWCGCRSCLGICNWSCQQRRRIHGVPALDASCGSVHQAACKCRISSLCSVTELQPRQRSQTCMSALTDCSFMCLEGGRAAPSTNLRHIDGCTLGLNDTGGQCHASQDQVRVIIDLETQRSAIACRKYVLLHRMLSCIMSAVQVHAALLQDSAAKQCSVVVVVGEFEIAWAARLTCSLTHI